MKVLVLTIPEMFEIFLENPEISKKQTIPDLIFLFPVQEKRAVLAKKDFLNTPLRCSIVLRRCFFCCLYSLGVVGIFCCPRVRFVWHPPELKKPCFFVLSSRVTMRLHYNARDVRRRVKSQLGSGGVSEMFCLSLDS